MSDHIGEAATVRLDVLNRRNSIRFAPFGQAPRAPEGRVFVVSGEYEPQALTAATEFLVNQASPYFKSIGRADDGNLRVVLQYNAGWRHALPFAGNTPAELALIHEKLGEVGDSSVLAYTIFVLCWYLNWSVSDVVIEETPLD